LLNMTSELKTRKQLRTSKGWIRPLQVPVHGYEIHTGVSKGPDLENYLIEYGDKKDGCISADGQIMGSYFHGLFDHPQACAALLQWAGLDQAETVDRNALREASLDRLADEIALHLDLSMVDQLVGLNAKV
ncbi:MAG: cobyric acid synthase CobQ, partial [Gammaproteobacteria bacterium]|nr:cobyric acid synthase CobQ [Gammaproteobacteria bacterium]